MSETKEDLDNQNSAAFGFAETEISNGADGLTKIEYAIIHITAGLAANPEYKGYASQALTQIAEGYASTALNLVAEHNT